MHNIGIIGYGAFGRFLKESWEELPNARVTFITKTQVESAKEMAERDGVPKYSADYRDVIADEDVDIVAIATPPYMHKEMAVEALKAGKHTLVEKPLAVSVADAEAILAAARKSGRIGAVNFMMRYSGLVEKLVALRTEGVLGGLNRIIVENYAGDEGLSPDHWFWDRAKSGGILIEHGVHFFDLARWVADSVPTRTVGFATERAPGVQDKVLACVQYEDSTMACFYHSFSRPGNLEETSARYVFDRGEVDVIGWIPMKLRLRGFVSDGELLRLMELFHGGDMRTSPLARKEVVSSGVTYPVSQEITLAYVHSTDKQAEYAACARGLMADMIRSIENPNHAMRVTMEDGLESVRTAQAAAESAASAL
ncbi:MAG: Gfo/Idh/MocA family oxidoreductase [Armatimonadota bacterium]|nr:Gfo/Idh/MocA family oxidoreductase [Armatimonadota bacterium]